MRAPGHQPDRRGIVNVPWTSVLPQWARMSTEHQEVSAFSRIRVRRDGDVRALTFVRDNGEEVVQSRVSLTAPRCGLPLPSSG